MKHMSTNSFKVEDVQELWRFYRNNSDQETALCKMLNRRISSECKEGRINLHESSTIARRSHGLSLVEVAAEAQYECEDL